MNDVAAANSLKLPLSFSLSLLGKFRRLLLIGIDGFSDNRIVIARLKCVKNPMEKRSDLATQPGHLQICKKRRRIGCVIPTTRDHATYPSTFLDMSAQRYGKRTISASTQCHACMHAVIN